MKRRGVIYSVGPSPKDVNIIWCGTDDGLVWVTQDGGANWSNVTPPTITSWSKVSQIDASHFSKSTAYISVNRLRCDDMKPYIYKTDDFGKTWKLIVNGLDNSPVNAVREDPKKPGLLFAATETKVCFSADDGANWNSLRTNMPATSIRDLVIHEDDLVIGTHGRGFWIMDSFNMLRNLEDILAKPPVAYQVEWNIYTDTPLPPEEPMGKNPPDGVALDYYLANSAKQVSIEIVNSKGEVVRKISSDDKLTPIDPMKITVDPRWAMPPQPLMATKGSHRYIWDLRTEGNPVGLGMTAIWLSTPTKRGVFVPPGLYTVKLTIDGKAHTQPLEIRPDPENSTK
jgi:hypothetical protein